MRTLIIVLTLLFSTLASADTYLFNANKVKDKDGTEYLIFKDERKVQLGFKVDGLSLVPIKDSKTDSIRKEIKKREEAKEKAKKEAKTKKLKNDLNNFINNLLKLSMTLLGILVIILSVSILSMLVWIGFYLYIKLKKL